MKHYSYRPLKRSESGLEVEFHIINNEGKICSKANQLINETKKLDKNVDVTQEVTQNLVELRSYPSVNLKDNVPALLKDLLVLLEAAEKLDLRIYPLATHAASFRWIPTKKKRYKISETVFGRNNYYYFGSRCAGFHYHYTLPRGIFNKGFLKPLIKSKVKQTLIDSYNLLTAIDPALTTFLQSSPFVDGNYLAKDSRMLLWRSSASLNHEENMFSNLKPLGELKPYLFTLSDLIERLNYYDIFFKDKLKENKLYGIAEKKKKLDFFWGPIKINKIGTIEQRGMDINHPKYFAAIAVMLKYFLRLVQEDFYSIVPSDIGISEPFKVEDETIYIPPNHFVLKKLQNASAYEGFANKDVFNYCKRFYRLANKMIPKDHKKTLKPIYNMLSRKKTVSDVLIGRVKRKGYALDEPIPDEYCQKLALMSSKQLFKEVEKTLNSFPN